MTAVVGWFILMYLSTNLLGLFLRGLFSNPELDKLEKEGHELIKEEMKKNRRANTIVNIVALILLAGFLYLLFHFLNMFAVIAALILMAARTPDLICEIRFGKKIKETPLGWLGFVTSILSWGSLPVFWYAIYTRNIFH